MDYEARIKELEAEVALRNRQLAAANKINAALSGHTNLDDLLQTTLEESLEAVYADAGSIILYEPDEDKLVFRYVIGEAKETLTGFKMEPTEGICGHVFSTGQPSIDQDVTKSDKHARAVDSETGYTTRNMVTVPLKTIEGDPVGVMQILNKHKGTANFDEHDIDVLMIMGAQAAAAIENARLFEEAKLAVVVTLMGDISHDVKNMITPITVCAQTLEGIFEGFFADLDRLYETHRDRDPELVEHLEMSTAFLRDFYPEAIQMFMEGSQAVQDRVREIADCVKGIVSVPTFEMLNINDVVGLVVQPLRLVAEQHQLAIHTDGLGEVPLVPLDQKQMYNAIYNLINNAISATPAGGSISVRTYAVQDGRAFPEGSFLMVEVADTGTGMPEHVRAKLFTKDAVSTKPGGTGLGTRIVKNVVDAHNGVITVESQQGVGTTFFMKIPLERPDRE